MDSLGQPGDWFIKADSISKSENGEPPRLSLCKPVKHHLHKITYYIEFIKQSSYFKYGIYKPREVTNSIKKQVRKHKFLMRFFVRF